MFFQAELLTLKPTFLSISFNNGNINPGYMKTCTCGMTKQENEVYQNYNNESIDRAGFDLDPTTEDQAK